MMSKERGANRERGMHSLVGRFCETPWRLAQTPYRSARYCNDYYVPGGFHMAHLVLLSVCMRGPS